MSRRGRACSDRSRTLLVLAIRERLAAVQRSTISSLRVAALQSEHPICSMAGGEMDQKMGLAAVVDHFAVDSTNLQQDVRDYERIGFQLETLYDDWAMLRDAKGFGLALLGPGSKHPPHIGLRVESREALEAAANQEGRTVKEHRDRSLSFYTKGAGGRAVEVIYYPPDYSTIKRHEQVG